MSFQYGGSFMAAIASELGLVRKRNGRNWSLSYKGQALLLEWKYAAKPEQQGGG